MGPQDHSQIQQFTKRTHRTEHIVVLLDLLQQKDAKANQQSKGSWGKVQRKPDASFQESFTNGVAQNVPNSSSTEL